MIQAVAFIAYAVRDIAASRRFYEGILGLKLTFSPHGDWFEYDLGDTTFVITSADAEHPTPIRAALVASEVGDLAESVARLRQLGAIIKGEIAESPFCQQVTILDPDGTELLNPQAKESGMMSRRITFWAFVTGMLLIAALQVRGDAVAPNPPDVRRSIEADWLQRDAVLRWRKRGRSSGAVGSSRNARPARKSSGRNRSPRSSTTLTCGWPVSPRPPMLGSALSESFGSKPTASISLSANRSCRVQQPA